MLFGQLASDSTASSRAVAWSWPIDRRQTPRRAGQKPAGPVDTRREIRVRARIFPPFNTARFTVTVLPANCCSRSRGRSPKVRDCRA